jgi:hypothetical protein
MSDDRSASNSGPDASASEGGEKLHVSDSSILRRTSGETAIALTGLSLFGLGFLSAGGGLGSEFAWLSPSLTFWGLFIAIIGFAAIFVMQRVRSISVAIDGSGFVVDGRKPRIPWDDVELILAGNRHLELITRTGLDMSFRRRDFSSFERMKSEMLARAAEAGVAVRLDQ